MNSVSVTGKKLFLRNYNQEDVEFLKANFFLDEITSKLLAIRKIKKEDIKNYLNPLIKNILPNPNILKDMEKSASRTVKAIINKEKIGIFGDYDVDGASSTAILGKYFQEIKKNYEIYIPDRKAEGYGPSVTGFKKLIEKKVNLIFTVDCGTLSFKPIDYAFNNKVDVLVLDHHQSEVKLPAYPSYTIQHRTLHAPAVEFLEHHQQFLLIDELRTNCHRSQTQLEALKVDGEQRISKEVLQ